ncbi:MAG: DJ-1/PfpI family protein [Chlamydiae bacterium]|nr:DJ-1/PfpI family protein [Chlamydiota bacterium]MBI3265641.1 DJ-1/PfpI family protein [Chlamydiota bacterium]
MNQKILVLLAEGFEEIEAITPIDVLRRAGLEVKVAGLTGKTVTGAHGIRIQADTTFSEYRDPVDLLLLPGGMPGAKNLGESKALQERIKKMNEDKKYIAAICASPALALAPTGILDGKKATCYPGYESHFSPSTKFSKDNVVVDANVITSRGPGTALEFSLTLVEKLLGKAKRDELKKQMVVAF